MPTMDFARNYLNASKVHTGDDRRMPYTGKGVVVGICDIGFDPSHPAFKNAEGNECRIRRITQYKESDGERIELNDYDEMLQWRTDTLDETHATHVAGIMAGGYKGNPYWGMAPDADIVVSTSQLSDVGLLAGVEDIIEYAKSVGKPAVINLSMGNYLGPHDGTSLFCQYMDLLAEEAIICLSAGNEGMSLNTWSGVISSDSHDVPFLIGNTMWNEFEMYGAVQAWSGSSTPITLRFGIYDEDERRIVHDFGVIHSGDKPLRISSDPAAPDFSPKFAEIYKGWVELSGGVWEENGRSYITMEYDAETTTVSNHGPWARNWLTFSVDAHEGEEVFVYADGIYSLLRGYFGGGPEPGPAHSFSDLATGRNTISVGMYYNRNSIPHIDGSLEQLNGKPFTISPHSGYDTLIDGRVMPLTVAPGHYIVSAASSHWLKANPEMTKEMVAVENINGENYYWKENSGTSMSTPYVGGVIATWLEACPSLDAEEVQRIIRATNFHDMEDSGNPRNGEGWIDPLKGLIEILSSSGMQGNIISGVEPSIIYAGGLVKIVNPYGGSCSLQIRDLSGKLVGESEFSGVSAEYRVSSLLEATGSNVKQGIYILTVYSESSRPKSLKIIL